MAFVGLGVSGGIGAYKAVEVARLLQKRGHRVQAVMTRSARRFVGPLTFEAITREPVITNQFAPGMNADIEHIALASTMNLLVVAPATANILGKFAHGIADDFLSALYLATRAPVLLAPAMNTNMWEHQAVRDNVARLAARGARFVDPGDGYLACGWIGKGRLAEPEDIVGAAERLLQSRSSLTGQRVLVTAGPTIEDLDPVRFIGNRSSGRMGYALASEAHDRGADVILIAGPTALDPPPVGEVVRVRSTREMHDAVLARADRVDAVIMAAAVADYGPAAGPSAQKIEKGGPMSVSLVRTPDILAALGERRGDRRRPVLVGFAAQTGDAVAPARRKLQSKRVDLVVANDISAPGAGFDVDTNQVTLVSQTDVVALPVMAKTDVASALLDRLEQLLLTPQAEATAPASR
ncbi:MAG TPA: bifunctional phosphopantothenoylcysteine decarboxylase/phosphopantothenate--cysteine ligase CoaBC [Vicinamibacterales bacterium]|nr:bifunctional phosphopantothenoylcysteine decarboxylase/phosphopantothenate--cysteine ligase CoaBC [Vicinamibacterales bacterium]